MRNTPVSLPRSLALIGVLTALCVTAFIVTGASSNGASLNGADHDQMERALTKYWDSIQLSWPPSLLSEERLPNEMKAEMKARRGDAAEQFTGGTLRGFEKAFEPGEYLEELRDSGTLVLDSGYEILVHGEADLTAANTAEMRVTVRTWSKEQTLDGAGRLADAPYTVSNDVQYRYVFERVGGNWRIVLEDRASGI